MTELNVWLPSEISVSPESLVNEAQIPLLPASKIGSGVLHPNRLPHIPADRIEGQLADEQLPNNAVLQEELLLALDGKADTAHTHPGLVTVSSSPPISPVEGERWLDTGDRLTWFWSGSRWYSEQLFADSVGLFAASNLASYGLRPVEASSYDLQLLSYQVGATVNTTNDPSNYWIATLHRRHGGSTTTIQTVSTSSWTAGQITFAKVDINIHLDVSALPVSLLSVFTQTVGSPGSFGPCSFRIRYRLIKP